MNIDFSELKKKIESELMDVVDSKPKDYLPGLNSGSFGHSSGSVFEDWMETKLKNLGYKVSSMNIFLEKLFQNLDNAKLIEIQKLWWYDIMQSDGHLREFRESGKVDKTQQDIADLVLSLAQNNTIEELEKIVIINVKSHNLQKKSRPPNIISAERLLKICGLMIDRGNFARNINKTELWFIGVDYIIDDDGGVPKEVNIKSLTKLDISKVPQINFDAAIQIQWHVKDMIENNQSGIDFIKNFLTVFLREWEKHITNKTTKYNSIVDKIKKNLISD